VLGAVPVRRGVTRGRARIATDDGACSSVPVLAMWMESGASFTGEDSLELSCVGAPAVVEYLATALIDGARAGGFGARLARAGEFAFRAHLAGRISVDEAEAIAARIAATSDAEIAASDEIAHGVFGARAAELLARTAEALALVEAGIDFTDQDDVVAIPADELARRAAAIAAACESLRGGQQSARANAVALVVLAGAPNAGKSTLFNALLGRARSVASDLAGTTRDAIVERIALGAGLEVDLADLAGLDGIDSAGPIELAMQRRAQEMLSAADVVVRCTPPGGARVELATASDVIDVATMADLAPVADELAGLSWTLNLSVSARSGSGIEPLRTAIAARIRRDRALRRARLATILPRHDAAFAAAHAALTETTAHASASATRGRRVDDVELVASLLRAALDALGEVAGPMHPDDVLGLVFSRFCIGK
jgi:tRNA modification GTPase